MRKIDREQGLNGLTSFLHDVENGISEEQMEKQVMIEKAINLRLVCDYAVSCSYGDVVLIICMLHDYVKILAAVRQDDVFWQAYYRDKFMKMADRLAAQIGYDYDKALDKCKKAQGKQMRDSDVGEDGITQIMKKQEADAEKKGGRRKLRAGY